MNREKLLATLEQIEIQARDAMRRFPRLGAEPLRVIVECAARIRAELHQLESAVVREDESGRTLH